MNELRHIVSCCVVSLAACAQAQMPSNVGGDGIDRTAAATALGSIERSACSESAGPRGTIYFSVVFAPDGNVTDAKLDRAEGDAPASAAIAGTPRGNCLLERLRELHVPSFKGKPTKVGRKLTLE
jgi:hypothetical protein